MNRNTGEILTDELAHIRQSIGDILLTEIGTRLQRRDYGSQIPSLLARPISRALLLQMASAAVMAITKWEPRIQITQFKPQINESEISASLVGKTKKGADFAINDLLLKGKQ